MRTITHFIDGSAASRGGTIAEVFAPTLGKVQAIVELGDAAVVDDAVKNASIAQIAWAATNPQRRARVLFRFKELIEDNFQELAELLASEHGKVVSDARGDIQRGLDVVEFACGIPHLDTLIYLWW